MQAQVLELPEYRKYSDKDQNEDLDFEKEVKDDRILS